MIKIIAIGIIGTILTLLIKPYRDGNRHAMRYGDRCDHSPIGHGRRDEHDRISAADRSALCGGITTLFTTMLKVTGIAYIAEFAVQACKDAGETGIASKIELSAKILILGMCAPRL